MIALERSHRLLQNDVNAMHLSMDSNTAALTEFIELGKALKFGLKFLGYVEKTAVWIAKVAAAIGIIVAAWKFLILEAINRAQR